MVKSWKENNILNRYREDYAQDKKELDYLRTRNAGKQDRRKDLLAKQKEDLKKCFDKLCDVLDELFEPFGFYTKPDRHTFSDDAVALCFKDEKDGGEYDITSFDSYYTFRPSIYDTRPQYEKFRDDILKKVVGRLMDALHKNGNGKYYPTMEEEFTSYEEGLAKIKQLVKDFAIKVQPIFEESAKILKKEIGVFTSDEERTKQIRTARYRARTSYLKENPIAPGMVVIWHLQNGDVEDVEVISVNDAAQTAKVKTDGGAVRNVPLSRLEVDTVRPGIDDKYW